MTNKPGDIKDVMKTPEEIREQIKELGKQRDWSLEELPKATDEARVRELQKIYAMANHHIDALNWVLNETK